MIIIEIRMVSARGREHDRILGKGVIANDGAGTHTHGNYNGIFKRVPGGKEYASTVKEFKRSRYGCWHLLAALLKAAGFVEEMK